MMSKSDRAQWFPEHENLLKDWGEKTRYYSWMHNKTGEYYSQLNNSLSIPMIILTTATASANFTMAGNTSMAEEHNVVIPVVTGIASVIAAILSGLTKFLQCAELSTRHEDCHLNFNKLTRNICLELSLPPIQRREPYDACHVFRTEYDRLMTESPSIPTFIIKKFNTKFPMVNNKPEIASEFGKIPIYGRGKTMLDNEERFRKIRTFYKWLSHTNDTKMSSTPRTYDESNLHQFDPNTSVFFNNCKKPAYRISFDSIISENTSISEERDVVETYAV